MSCSDSSTQKTKEEPEESALFEEVSSDASGIQFSNDLKHDVSTKANLFDFDYFYNGAGVAMVDINNDGLQDIFFTGNQVPNRLYLNRGELRFEDISEQAGINAGKRWSNGVTIADINGDGWSDIYVSQGGPNEEYDRGNLLFINNQDNTFSEKAKDYGLADQGISTQAGFFDFDRDGDLDCFVLNESPAYGLDPVTFYRQMRVTKGLLGKSSSHLYENDGGVFKDITAQAGMLRPSFGLGLSISDINDDGWLDIYIANDYYIPDAMYINQGNGRFFDEIKLRASQVSFFGMGVDIADFNNDLHKDILVLDMASKDHYRSKTLMASMDVDQFDMLTEDLGFAHQYMFNSLQLNTSNQNFRNVSHQMGISKTDWSWAGLITDFDNDGWKDIYVTNGYRRYALDNDFKNEVTKTQIMYRGNVPISAKSELYEQMNSEKLPNVLYKNDGKFGFSDVSKTSGLGKASFSNGAAYGDLDNDGDLDLVVNNLDQEAFLFQNKAVDSKAGNYLTIAVESDISESFPKVYIKYGAKAQVIEIKGVRGYFSYVEPVAHFGLGPIDKVDTVQVVWPGGETAYRYDVQANQRITIKAEETEKMSDAKEKIALFQEADLTKLGLDYRHVENEFDDFRKEVLLPYKQSTLGPAYVMGDVNGDGLEDIYLGGASGQAASVYVQRPDGFIRLVLAAFETDKVYEDISASLFDIDGDDDLDLYVVSGGNEHIPDAEWYEDRLYINDGKGNFERQQFSGNTPKFSGGVVKPIDFDGDGDQDLIVGNRIRPQQYPIAGQSQILINDGGKLVDVTSEVAPQLLEQGIINDILVSDFNDDGKPDFFAVGEWGEIGLFRNTGVAFEKVTESYGLEDIKGWWFSVTETDANQDGLPDYVVGNVGLNTKFKASVEKPFKVYANDFDANGTLDVVLSQSYKEKYVPVRGRECSSEQMPFLAKKYETYSSFANASIDEIFGEELNESLALEVNEFRSVLLINKGAQGFEVKPLPNQAQTFPLLSTVTKDLDGDGLDEIILAGNIYNTEVETPRWDGGTGLVLKSDGKGNYHAMQSDKTGIFLSGNVKDLQWLSMEGQGELLLAIRSNGPVSVFNKVDSN
ncbi:MAG: VCBS repeat-containing protein [Cytophagales bacterium]|nr:VCBS repeat-containing protein [Cytophagales bacterium]